MVAHPTEAGDRPEPRTGQARDVQAVADVAVEVVQVRERGLRPVVVGEVEVPYLGGDHRLRGGRQRGVPHRPRLVVGEVAGLLLGRERVAAHVHGQHQVGLLDDLRPVELEVRVVEQQGVRLRRGAVEVPLGVGGEVLRLLVDAEHLVVGQHDRVGRPTPQLDLVGGHVEPAGDVGLPAAGVGGRPQVPLCHQVREHVVVDHGRVLVGSGDSVDAEAAVTVEVPQGDPEPGGLDQQLDPARDLEVGVVGRRQVADDGVGDVRVDVERRRPGRPVAGALLAVDRPPRERDPAQPQLRGALAGLVHRRVPPAQRVPGRGRHRVGQHRQNEGLGVPERVPVVARAGQPLGGQRL